MVVNGGLSTTPKTRQAALYYVSVFILWNQRNKCSLCLKQRDKRRVKKPRSERTKIKLNFAGFAIVAFQRLLKFIQSGTWRCSRVPAGIRWSYGGEPRCGWYKGTFKNSKASLPPTVASSLTPSSPTKIQGNVSQVYFNSNNLSLQDRILQTSETGLSAPT